jgi:hypothetical protein
MRHLFDAWGRRATGKRLTSASLQRTLPGGIMKIQALETGFNGQAAASTGAAR